MISARAGRCPLIVDCLRCVMPPCLATRRWACGLPGSRQVSKHFRTGVALTEGQTTVKEGDRRLCEVGDHLAELVFRGADDGNRTRVFSLGS
jgi:hypothetical protein